MVQLLYLYGIFPAPGPSDLGICGLDGKPVATHVMGRLAFLYSEAQQERYLASRKHLLGHEKVLEAAMNQGATTLLPLRFGLVIESWERVIHELIEPHEHELMHLFKKLEGHREVSVKVMWHADQELAQLMAEDTELQQARDQLEGKLLSMEEVITIGQSIEQAMTARKAAVVETFRETLAPFAIETVENDLLTDAMIYNTAYLIPWESEEAFGQAIEELDAQFPERLRIRYNSFTAPFNFAQLGQL